MPSTPTSPNHGPISPNHSPTTPIIFQNASPTTPTMSKKASLESLPPELFESIARVAEPTDLLSLRLVNRESAEKVFKVYKETHFTDLKALFYSKSSFETAIAIARHPVFRKCITSLTVYIDQIVAFDFDPQEISQKFRELYDVLSSQLKRLHLTYSDGKGPRHCQVLLNGVSQLRRPEEERNAWPFSMALKSAVEGRGNRPAVEGLTELSTRGWAMPLSWVPVEENHWDWKYALEKLEKLDLHASDWYRWDSCSDVFQVIAESAPLLTDLTILGDGKLGDETYLETFGDEQDQLWELDLSLFDKEFTGLRRLELHNISTIKFNELKGFLRLNRTIQDVRVHGKLGHWYDDRVYDKWCGTFRPTDREIVEDNHTLAKMAGVEKFVLLPFDKF